MSTTDYDAIVVGSGSGGLAAALTLARCGASVLVLEAMPALGGYLNPFRRSGYSFDIGIHYLGKLARREPFQRMLKHLGLSDALEFIELNPQGFERYVFPDFEFEFCKGDASLKERYLAQFPRESSGIERFFSILRQCRSSLPFFGGMPNGLWAKINFARRHSALLRYHRASFQKLLDRVTRTPQLQAVLAAPCLNSGLPPRQASAIFCMLLLDHYVTGAYYPKGGSGALRDAFVDALRRQGVVLKTNCRVAAIGRQGERFTVQARAGEQWRARTVVSNADPMITLGALTAQWMLPMALRRKAARLRPSAGAFYAFVGTDLDLPAMGITDANIVHFDNYDINAIFSTIMSPQIPSAFPYFFISSPSVKDPGGGHAPPGCHTLEIVTGMSYEVFAQWSGLPSRRRGDGYESLKGDIGHRLIRAAERYVPGLSRHLTFVEFATPLSNEYWVNAPCGGNFGLEQTPDQIGRGRFSRCTTGIDGLYLAGSGTLCSGVMSCVASGLMAGNKASEYLGLF